MKSGQSLVWTKYREANEVIDLHGLFSGYWSSKNHEFTVMSQLSTPTMQLRISSDRKSESVVIGKHSGSLEVQFSANDTVRTPATTHLDRLIIFA